jgi:hypothetical protein
MANPRLVQEPLGILIGLGKPRHAPRHVGTGF